MKNIISYTTIPYIYLYICYYYYKVLNTNKLKVTDSVFLSVTYL